MKKLNSVNVALRFLSRLLLYLISVYVVNESIITQCIEAFDPPAKPKRKAQVKKDVHFSLIVKVDTVDYDHF